MSKDSASASGSPPAPDANQKKRLILGVLVWAAGWGLGLSLVPVVNASDLATGLKGTLNAILLLGFPKLFLLVAVAIMGKPGFAYLKSLIVHHVTPAATVSPLRYRIGLILLVSALVLASVGEYVAPEVLTFRQQHRYINAMAGDVLILVSLFLLGGDFWDKLRALFIREAKVVFPPK